MHYYYLRIEKLSEKMGCGHTVYSESKIHVFERKPFQKRIKVNTRILTKIIIII